MEQTLNELECSDEQSAKMNISYSLTVHDEHTHIASFTDELFLFLDGKFHPATSIIPVWLSALSKK